MTIDLTRRDALLGLSAGAVAAALLPMSARAATEPMSFLALGDWGREGAYHQRAVADQMGALAGRVGAQFILSVGDNFYERGVRSVQDSQWRTSFEQVYTATSLQIPWHAVLGNHDHRGDPQAQIDYTQHSPRWRMPARYYKAPGLPLVDMFMIDTSPMVPRAWERFQSVLGGNIETPDVGAQLAWLDRELALSRAPWKIVVGHHTIYSGGSLHGNTPELIARVKPILERHGVQVYINGHDHDLQHLRVGSIDYICTGAGSEVRPVTQIPGTRFCLARSGFSHLALSPDALALEFWDYLGSRVYSAVIHRDRAQHAEAA